jgi:hypothetical protein
MTFKLVKIRHRIITDQTFFLTTFSQAAAKVAVVAYY